MSNKPAYHYMHISITRRSEKGRFWDVCGSAELQITKSELVEFTKALSKVGFKVSRDLR